MMKVEYVNAMKKVNSLSNHDLIISCHENWLSLMEDTVADKLIVVYSTSSIAKQSQSNLFLVMRNWEKTFSVLPKKFITIILVGLLLKIEKRKEFKEKTKESSTNRSA